MHGTWMAWMAWMAGMARMAYMAFMACMACLSFGRLSNMQIVLPFNKLKFDPLQHKFPAHASAY